MTETELAWLAGLLEGEGCFYFAWRKNADGTRRPLISVLLTMTDEDVVRRAHAVAGFGTVMERPASSRPKSKAIKDAWTWQHSNATVLRPFLETIRPLMGERRAAKIGLMLELTEGFKPIRVIDHGTHTKYQGGCRCAVCRAGHARRHRQYILKREEMASCPPVAHKTNTCRNGHEFTVENTYVSKAGYRTCRACHRASDARRKAAT